MSLKGRSGKKNMDQLRGHLITIEKCWLASATSLNSSSSGLSGAEARVLWTEDKREASK